MLRSLILITLLCAAGKPAFSQDSLWATPNPFRDTTHIHFRLSSANIVSLSVYNRWGELMDIKWKDTFFQAGTYSITCGLNWKNGVYIVRLMPGSLKALTGNIIKNGPELSIYPNPFTDSTSINFRLLEDDAISIAIYNHAGKLTDINWKDTFFTAGCYSLFWGDTFPVGYLFG